MDSALKSQLRINPGGALTPSEVVGRDQFIEEIWGALRAQSVLLTAERRMGKTSVLLKMEHEAEPSYCVIRRTLQGVRSPQEFVRRLVADVERGLPGLLKRSIGDRLAAAGVARIGSTPLSVEFAPASERAWIDVAMDTFATLDADVDILVVILWDELPQMIADIQADHGRGPARQVLDLLRSARESHPGLRMVLSGSLGIHHVEADLRDEGGMWMPTHDMRSVDLPALRDPDAAFLASELLLNEGIECEEREEVAAEIARRVDRIPFYVHQVALKLRQRHRAGGAPVRAWDVDDVVAAAIGDPADPWELAHYVHRTRVYYGGDAALVDSLLDIVAVAGRPLAEREIRDGLAALGPPPDPVRLRQLLDLLCRDHYLSLEATGYQYLRELVRRAWIARRPAP